MAKAKGKRTYRDERGNTYEFEDGDTLELNQDEGDALPFDETVMGIWLRKGWAEPEGDEEQALADADAPQVASDEEPPAKKKKGSK